MKTPKWWLTNNVIATLLTPAAWLWEKGAAMRQRNGKPIKLSVPVICIGNVTAGGGGKTPVAIALGEWLKARHVNAYFVSRGYGAKVNTPIKVDAKKHSARDVGDEPLLLAKILPTIVCNNRLKAAAYAIEQGALMIILDDGLQDPSIAKDASIFVLKGNAPFGNHQCIPAGPLREPVQAALSRTNAIITLDMSDSKDLQSTKAQPPLYALHTQLVLPEIVNNNIVAFAGIAHPKNFAESLKNADIHVVELLEFSDHHAYTDKDFATIVASALKHNATIVTTEKDAVRIAPDTVERLNIIVARQQLVWPHDQAIEELLHALLPAFFHGL